MKTAFNLFFLSTLCCISIQLSGQNVAINDNGAVGNVHSILDIDVSTNDKGVLIPRLTSAERTAIAGLGAADEGLSVYDVNYNLKYKVKVKLIRPFCFFVCWSASPAVRFSGCLPISLSTANIKSGNYICLLFEFNRQL